MRGLLMALIAPDFPDHTVPGDCARLDVAKTPAKTTSKATTGKTV